MLSGSLLNTDAEPKTVWTLDIWGAQQLEQQQ